MPNKLRSHHKVRLDPLQAVKRASMHRGVVLGDQQAPQPEPQPEPETGPSANKDVNKATPKQKGKLQAKLKPETKQAVSPEAMGEKRSLEKPPKDSASAKGPENLVELTENSLDILYEATTVFPFTLFPDTITLDREKVTIAKRTFWRVANITSTPISEIMTVEANVGPFFGALHLTFRFFTDNQRTITFLTRDDATHLQRLLHGYIIAHRREIDTSNVDLEDLKTLLLELGQGASD